MTADDATMPPPADAFLFIGSSSIRLWETLAEDMAPMQTIRRGFGGSKLRDAIYYIDRIITPYNPRAVVVFSGSNDIAGENPKQAREVLALYMEFVSEVQNRLPGTPIYYIAITPTWSRWEHHELVDEANRLIEHYSGTNDDLYFIDTASAVLDENGEPRKELFREDQLHLNADGYKVWTSVIKPVLLASMEPVMAQL
jgi:lysophospholipase L1-like esterase